MNKLVNLKEFEEENKNYYRWQEDYDWIKVTDSIVGLESFFHRIRQKNFLKLLKRYLSHNQRILDAGCGTGLFARFLPPGSYAVDINPRNIVKAKAVIKEINFYEADLEKLPFDDHFFDLIIITEVIEHFPNPQKTLLELKRVLKSDGLILGTVPSKSFIWQLRFLSSTRPREPFHYYYKKKELKRILEQFFNLKNISRDNFSMSISFVAENK